MVNIISKSFSGIITFYYLLIFIQNLYKHKIYVSINVSFFSAIITIIILSFLEYIKYKDKHIKKIDRLNYTIFNHNKAVEIILSVFSSEELNRRLLKKSKNNYYNSEEYSKIIQ